MLIIIFRMDMQKSIFGAPCADLAELSRQKLVVGAKQLRKAMSSGRAKLVYLAENADPAITGPIQEMCSNLSIRFTWVRSMTELGQACGIEVGAAAAAVVG